MFVLGCQSLTVTTDHQPLLGIFCDSDLGTIANPQLKDCTLHYQFNINYCPEKWLQGPDAVSHFPSIAAVHSSSNNPILDLARKDINSEIMTFKNYDINTVTEAISAFHNSTNSIQLTTIDQLVRHVNIDREYKSLVSTISSGFSDQKNALPSHLRVYWDL